MDRREFVKILGAGAALAAVPEAVLAAISGMSEDEIEARVKELLSQMTLEEKIEQMHGALNLSETYQQSLFIFNGQRYAWPQPENKRLGIPAFKMVDGPRGSALGHSTCFPVGIMRGATWDPRIEKRVGAAMGYETRAQGANVHLSPCINLVRHPSGGRNQETFGEDTYHVGVMGVAQATGIQEHVMACPKHYAVNNIEGNRFKVDARLDERVLREVYLPQFKMCVDAGAASIMSSYNDVNGHLAGQNRHLCREILKEEWGFQGFVVTDWVNALDDAVAGIHGGVDIEMPVGRNYGSKLKKAVKNGKAPMELIDESVTRLLRMKFRFISKNFQSGYSISKVAGSEHTALALEAAQKGIVLLRNENKALPLCDKVRTLAVLGELADFPNIGDHGSSQVNPPYVITPLQGIQDRAGSVKVIHVKGNDLAGAKKAAREADAVIVVAGATYKDEGEGGGGRGDRLDLNLHKQDADLIDAVAAETERLIVVLEGGGAFTLESWKDKAEAIVMAWYPGMEGGHAIADVLFGRVNPSGKLPVTFHKSEDQLPYFDNTVDFIDYDYWHGYRLFEKEGREPSYPFGFGLSYTEYEYSNLRLDGKKVGKSGNMTAKVDVKNVGEMAGEEIVQLYVGYSGSKVYRSIKDLKAFARVALAPGEKKTVSLEVEASDLAYYNVDAKAWEVEEIEYVAYVGPSSRKEDLLSDTFRVSGI